MDKLKQDDEKKRLVSLLRQVEQYFDYYTNETRPIRSYVSQALREIDAKESGIPLPHRRSS